MSTDLRTGPDAGDDGFHEIQLNGKQLVFLGMATTLVSVVIFLCGVLVGRGVRPFEPVAEAAAANPPVAESTIAEAAPPATPPSAAPAPAPEPTPARDSSYYDALPVASKSGAPTDAAKAEGSAVPVVTKPEPAPRTEPAPAAPAAPKATATVKVEPAKANPAKADPVKLEPPRPAPAEVAKAEPKPSAPKVAETPAAVAATPGGKVAVQVAAFSSRAEAEVVARRLSGKGYAVYVVDPAPGAKAVFRVRVGKYASLDEAQRISSRLAQEEKLKPWIIR